MALTDREKAMDLLYNAYIENPEAFMRDPVLASGMKLDEEQAKQLRRFVLRNEVVLRRRISRSTMAGMLSDLMMIMFK